jgi:hypothetical protein
MQRIAILLGPDASVASSESIHDFAREIRPPLAEHGSPCHGYAKTKSGLNLEGVGDQTVVGHDFGVLLNAQFVSFVEQPVKIPVGTGRLIDKCDLLPGAGIRDDQQNSGKNWPILSAGGGGGIVLGGRQLKVGMGAPLVNLPCEIAKCIGLQPSSFANSSDRLKGL